MKFEIIPVREKRPLKAISKFIAVTAVCCVIVECIDDLVLDKILAKKTYTLRKHLASKYGEKLTRTYVDSN